MDIYYKGSQLKLPDFLIVGAPRAGSTTLYAHLSRHPQVHMPDEKEPSFFACWGKEPFYRLLKTKERVTYVSSALKDYQDLFLSANKDQIIGEASTWYLYLYKDTISNIKEIYGEKSDDLKIIILLRNPVDRAWSHYNRKKINGEETLAFSEAILPETIQNRKEQGLVPSYDYLGMGMYHDQVEAYLMNFHQTKIFIYEDFFENPSAGMASLTDFLEIDNIWIENPIKTYNASGLPKNKFAGIVDRLVFRPNRFKDSFKFILPSRIRKDLKFVLPNRLYKKDSIKIQQRDELRDAYKSDIKRLEKLIEKDLSRWMEAK